MAGSTEGNSASAEVGADEQDSEPGPVPKPLSKGAATLVGTIAAGAGSIIVEDLQHRQALMFAALGLIAVVGGTWAYVLPRWRKWRSRGPAGQAPPKPGTQGEEARPDPDDGVAVPPSSGEGLDLDSGPEPPDSPEDPPPTGEAHRRFRLIPVAQAICGLIVATCALPVATFVLGYWTVGNGLAHGILWGLLALAGVVFLLGIGVIAWYGHRRSRKARVRPGLCTTIAVAVASLGLSAGGTLGKTHLAPPCPLPTEISVLASQENLSAVQAAATVFEQNEPMLLHQSCYAADLTVYAARSDAEAETDLESGWGANALSADGPRPGVWIPSSAEAVRIVNAAASPSSPRMENAGKTGSSPLVIAVPTSLTNRYDSHGAALSGNWGGMYRILQGHGIGLNVPNPRQSTTGALGITNLSGDHLTPEEERQIAAAGEFPPDSGIMLCAAAQAAEQGHLPASAYLVSEVAFRLYTSGRLSEGACPTLGDQPPSFTMLYPSDASSLDFPFVTLDWGGNSTAARAAQSDEAGFYHWLASPAGQAVLDSYGLRSLAQSMALPALPAQDQVQRALQAFTGKAPPVRILIAIDDSGPMQPYLQQIASAVTEVLGAGTSTSPGASDSFGIWAYPGAGTSTYQTLVPLGGGDDRQRDAVAASVSTLSAHAHSAEFDLLTSAARVLYGSAKTEQAISSVILLTDGDSYANGQDPEGDTLISVQDLLHPLVAAQPPIRVSVIAFGDPGCAQAPPGRPQDTLTALATSNGGSCMNVEDLVRELGQAVSQPSAGR
jgi:hypothetical protein